MTTNKANTILWIALVILISLSYFFSEKHIQSAAVIIALVSIVKFLSVGYQFMETKHAHIFWNGLLVFFTLVYFIGVFVFY